MRYRKDKWEELENSGIGYDFYDGKNLKVRKFDNKKSYVLIKEKHKELFYIENNQPKKTKSSIESLIKKREKELKSLIKKKEKELEILKSSYKQYCNLENV